MNITSRQSKTGIRVLLMGVLAGTPWPVPAAAQEGAAATPEQQQQSLAQQLSNPIADLVSVPFQFNWDQNVGPDDQTRFILNVQPVMPFSLNEDWNLITRVIVPLVSQPPLFEGGTAAFGVSDVLTSFFFSPRRGGLTWGVGPVISLPSTSVPTLGTEKWGAGPTAVVLKQTGPWTVGALWNQVWSFSGNEARADVNQMFLQPFAAYQATPTITLSLSSEATANWEVDEGRWTVPITATVSKLSSFGAFPASYAVGVGGFAVHPSVGPTWRLRGVITILLPRRR
jgi:hypothetical protein